MNITSVNQKLSVSSQADNDIRKVQAAGIHKKNTGIEIEENTGISNDTKAVPLCHTTVETDVTALSGVLGQEEGNSAANQQALDYMANHMTEQDYEELAEEGYSMEDFEAERLEKALERRKENRELRQECAASQLENKELRRECIDTRIENKDEFREDIEKIAISNKISDPTAKKMAQKLAEANLPVTEANLEAMLNAMKLSDVIPQLSEEGIASLIAKESPITLESIYHSQYSSIRVQAPGEEIWQAVKGQAENILTAAGIEVSEENMEQAKWLFDHNLPISENTFDTYNSLLELREGVSEDVIIDKMTEAMKRGLAPEQADLNIVMSDKIEQAVSDFAMITEEAVAKAVENGEKINLVNLKNAQQAVYENTSGKRMVAETSAGVVDGNAVLGNGTADEASVQGVFAQTTDTANKNAAEITAYRQLEEIRLKLTLESAHSLARKGIRIDTSELQRIVEGLKEMEKQYYANLLEEGNAEKTEANISILKAATETVVNIRQVPAAVLGSTLKQNIGQSLDSLYQAGTELKASYDKAETAYEPLMTAPRKDMGDSIQKAFRNIDAILEGLNMEVTEDNQRAVRILGYNRMEINENSIAAVKAYDSQVTSLVDELHPAATVELIKRGVNPLDVPMEQLINEVKQIKDELGVTEEEKYSTYLWKLDKQNGITQEERKSYIGIYRLLNNIEKTDGAAIGAVLDTGKELTMGNLLTAVRTMKHKGIDVEVNDVFGALTSLTFSKETITDQIAAGLNGTQGARAGTSGQENTAGDGQPANTSVNEEEQLRQNQITYQTNVVEEILSEISPDKLVELSEKNGTKEADLKSFMNMSLEEFKDALSEVEGDREIERSYAKEMTEHIRRTAEGSKEALAFLEQFHQPVSIENLNAATEYFTGSKNIFKELKKKADNVTESIASGEEGNSLANDVEAIMEGLAESVGDAEALQQKFEELETAAEEILNKEYENPQITSEDLRNLRLFGKGMALTGSMSRQEHYEIPIITGDTITNVSLTIRKNAGEKGKLQITMNSEKFGRIEVEASIKEQAINGVILCESKDGLDKLKDCQPQIKAELESLGLTVKQLSAAMSDKALEGLRTSEDSVADKTETAMLYKAAKVFVEQLKAAETE